MRLAKALKLDNRMRHCGSGGRRLFLLSEQFNSQHPPPKQHRPWPKVSRARRATSAAHRAKPT